MTSEKRYRLEKLISYNPKTKIETWKKTGPYSNNISALENFLADDYRIFDTKNNVEVKRNVNLETWI